MMNTNMRMSCCCRSLQIRTDPATPSRRELNRCGPGNGTVLGSAQLAAC